MNDRELTRLADAAASLRPDWRAPEVRVFLAKHCRARAFADAAVALAVVAADETQQTPRLLAEPGARCWRAAQAVVAMQAGVTPDPPHPMCQAHPEQRAGRCTACEAEAVPPPVEVVAVAQRHRTKAHRAVFGHSPTRHVPAESEAS